MQCKPHAHLIFLLAQVRSLPPSHQTSLLSTAPCSCKEKCMEAQILARLASCMKPADYLAAALAGRMKPFVSRLRCSSWREAFCQHFPSCSHGCARVRTPVTRKGKSYHMQTARIREYTPALSSNARATICSNIRAGIERSLYQNCTTSSGWQTSGNQ